MGVQFCIFRRQQKTLDLNPFDLSATPPLWKKKWEKPLLWVFEFLASFPSRAAAPTWKKKTKTNPSASIFLPSPLHLHLPRNSSPSQIFLFPQSTTTQTHRNRRPQDSPSLSIPVVPFHHQPFPTAPAHHRCHQQKWRPSSSSPHTTAPTPRKHPLLLHTEAFRHRQIRLRPPWPTSARSTIWRRKEQQTGKKKKKETDLKEEKGGKQIWKQWKKIKTDCLLCFWVFSRSPLFLKFPAVAYGEDAPPCFLHPQRAARYCSEFFRVYFVNFKLFNVLFI